MEAVKTLTTIALVLLLSGCQLMSKLPTVKNCDELSYNRVGKGTDANWTVVCTSYVVGVDTPR